MTAYCQLTQKEKVKAWAYLLTTTMKSNTFQPQRRYVCGTAMSPSAIAFKANSTTNTVVKNGSELIINAFLKSMK